MIVITGAAGFIGSCLVAELNKRAYEDLILVDDFNKTEKANNLKGKKYRVRIDRNDFLQYIQGEHPDIDYVFHIGARTDTAEFNMEIFNELNIRYSKEIWLWCTRKQIPLMYASSAATYGMGENGYNDDHDIVEALKPLNRYGESKNEFDKWVLKQKKQPPFWIGYKFFNVYGPNEYHKGRMASVIFHAYHQILENNSMKLFRSHNKNYKDGEQLRDFVYVKDLCDLLIYQMNHGNQSGLYNLGTGKARTFLDLVKATFAALGKDENISFIDTPEDIRDKYQYFTEANMKKVRKTGYTKEFHSLEEGVKDYVCNYLMKNEYY